ncbi:hypothetical protein LPUS_06516 [Lasallia pustulata]|uniref:Uncharacterized protein n=1 Tax=Lasallia pustulata TaxID=136370 RepID=A0A1W5D1S4_9LECA|nr:hypothetical protein LPUS_06516 [Lasallia pustulata]
MSVGTTTIVSTITKFVPCSTAVATSGTKTYYTTSLTASYSVTAITSTITGYQVICPTTTNPVAPAAITFPPNTVYGSATGTCPPAQTVYSTVAVYITVTAGAVSPGSPGSAGGSAAGSASASAPGPASASGSASGPGSASITTTSTITSYTRSSASVGTGLAAQPTNGTHVGPGTLSLSSSGSAKPTHAWV